MTVLGQVLVQFVFRVTFGLALAMGLTSPRQVTSGYYRVHLWVLMGLNTLAALATFSARKEPGSWTPWYVGFGAAIGLALLSYVAAVVWLYERPVAGRWLLGIVAGMALIAAVCDLPPVRVNSLAGVPGHSARPTVSVAPGPAALSVLDILTSGGLMGANLAAMLLGHWYLSHPSMELRQLRRLLLWMGWAVALRIVVCGVGVALQAGTGTILATSLSATFLAFRWLAGLGGPLLMVRLAWQTLKIPNTQSATGILYASVVLVFLGELVAQLLSVDSPYPV